MHHTLVSTLLVVIDRNQGTINNSYKSAHPNRTDSTMATSPADITAKKPLPSFEELNRLRLEGYGTDITISTREGTDVRAHRVIMVASCPAMKEELATQDELNFSRFPLS